MSYGPGVVAPRQKASVKAKAVVTLEERADLSVRAAVLIAQINGLAALTKSGARATIDPLVVLADCARLLEEVRAHLGAR